jgi:hypothetical protein
VERNAFAPRPIAVINSDNGRRIMLRKIVTVAALAGSAALLNGVGEAQVAQQVRPAAPVVTGRQFTPPYYVFSPDIPPDIVVQDVGAIGFQPFVDNLAWDAFIALNWPVPSPIVQRGVPDRQNVVGGFTYGGEGGRTTMPRGPTVWETYKDSNDIYLNPPVTPTSFDAPEIIPPQCRILAAQNPAAALRTLTRTAKISEVLEGIEQADGNRLVDQNGQNVWYEVKLNRVYYDYVVNNRFYDSRNQSGKTIFFPWSSNNTANEATVKVKAAWKVMGLLGSRQPDDLTKFYTTQALVVDPTTGQCSERLLGLVGLHIVIKTQLLPQWLWATFEQVDNAPDQTTGPVPGKQYNFFSAQCAGCPLNMPPAKGSNRPTQVVRVIPIDSVAASRNALYQPALRTLRPDNVWQHYMLVNAQWSGTREPIGVPTQPKFLANTTLETYMQAQTQPYGCINCHGMYAASTDLDFQLTNAYPRNPARVIELLKVPGVILPKER